MPPVFTVPRVINYPRVPTATTPRPRPQKAAHTVTQGGCVTVRSQGRTRDSRGYSYLNHERDRD